MTTFEDVRELQTVNVARAGGVARIELNRPDALNAWDEQLGHDLRQAVEAAAQDDDVRAVLLTGAGRAFSSGANLRSMPSSATSEGRPDLQKMLTERYHPIITAVRTMPKPVVAAVNGPCAGIGVSLALAADLIVARERAYFVLAFVNVGLVPDGGTSFLVPNRVGFARAAEMAMLGERIPAAQALEWGLINRVFADDAFEGESDRLAQRLADGPTRSYAGAKRQLNAWLLRRMEEQLELEASIQQEMAGSDDFVEGVSAFVQKRTASFRGR
jgi:2-(1,2-epoxy-1,2-dihydrophenyl)acetyl-CoA isomerase